MKHFGPLLLALVLSLASCEKHKSMEREISRLESTIQETEKTIKQQEADIAALGGTSMIASLNEQTEAVRQRATALEFENGSRDRKWSGIEAEYSRLKPAAEAFKASQPK